MIPSLQPCESLPLPLLPPAPAAPCPCCLCPCCPLSLLPPVPASFTAAQGRWPHAGCECDATSTHTGFPSHKQPAGQNRRAQGTLLAPQAAAQILCHVPYDTCTHTGPTYTPTHMMAQVGTIRLASFNARALRDVAAALDNLTASGATEIVLDLRDNRCASQQVAVALRAPGWQGGVECHTVAV